jgi:hypothetical protein
MIKVYKINDCDWWAGKSFEECLAAANEWDQRDWSSESDLEPMSEDSLRATKYHDGGDYVSNFYEALQKDIANGTEFPCLFASTEY